MITAYLRLQSCVTNSRKAFVSRNWAMHGTARGQIHYYEVSGPTWNAIKRELRANNVMGVTSVREGTVQGSREGQWEARPLRQIPVSEVPGEFRHALTPGCYRVAPMPTWERNRRFDGLADLYKRGPHA
jgi:hypothetical protein